MVKLRLKRLGRKNRCYYRLCAMDSRTRRNGRAIEELGTYDPIERDPAKQMTLDLERIKYWLSVGAQPSDTALKLVSRAGVEIPKHLTSRRELIAKQRDKEVKQKAEHQAKKAAARAEAQAKNAKKADAAPAAEGQAQA